MRTKQLLRVIELGVSSANMNSVDQVRAIAALAQEAARNRVEAASLTDIAADNSTGSADTDGILAAITLPTATTADGVILMAPKAGFDTAIGVIADNQADIAEVLNTVLATVGSPRSVDHSDIAADPDGTLAAVTSALTGVADTTCLDAATGRARLRTLANNTSALAGAINYAAIALGMLPLTDNTGGTFSINADGSTDLVDAAASGTAVTTGADSLPEVATETALAALTDSLATMAAWVSAMVGVTAANGGPLVVATSNAGTRFKDADVDFSS